MKIEYEDKSYIEVSNSNNPNMAFITVAAKSMEDKHTLIVNSVEITKEQIIALIKSLQ